MKGLEDLDSFSNYLFWTFY